MGKSSTPVLTLAIAAILSILFIGCSCQKSGAGLPPVLKIGILPEERNEALQNRFEPLRIYLSESLDMPCELVWSKDYDEFVEKFGARKIDLAFFGGLTYLQANAAYGAVPLVTRDIDTRSTSYFVVRADSPIMNINDCENRALAFGSRRSTSGHLMPRHFLVILEIVPEEFFSEVHYSGAHDKTVEMVRDGKVDVGVVNSLTFKSMLSDGRAKESEFRILWETPPYTGSVWAVQPGLSKASRIKLRNAFLTLSANNEQQQEILRRLDSKGFLPADEECYFELGKLAAELGFVQ